MTQIKLFPYANESDVNRWLRECKNSTTVKDIKLTSGDRHIMVIYEVK